MAGGLAVSRGCSVYEGRGRRGFARMTRIGDGDEEIRERNGAGTIVPPGGRQVPTTEAIDRGVGPR